MINLKIIYSVLWVVISSLLCISFGQDIGIAQTPSQMAFEVGLLPKNARNADSLTASFELRGNQTIAVIGTPTQQTFELRGSQSTLGTETPSQQAFVLRSVEPTRGTEISAQSLTGRRESARIAQCGHI